mmetsp:Transcript_12910/g.29308  ORF Transcript_12910/g.29308 Transcript_12910/m.29308 type:complete len:92 (+) Transcript_12910:557-832(+)
MDREEQEELFMRGASANPLVEGERPTKEADATEYELSSMGWTSEELLAGLLGPNSEGRLFDLCMGSGGAKPWKWTRSMLLRSPREGRESDT